ncbi:MAG: sigma-70 family RNA polymerase sigma factor [Sedimentisphaerales bacterium]|nr:sigma-70 family RNA polymerase sigma factor [Sedimentisphaerales bacterium]
MLDKAVSCGTLWDFIGSETIAEDQRWVLSAMQKHGPELVTMLWRILANEQDVCDAYQDTFLQLAHYEGGRKPENIKAYIFRVANNVAISMLRRKIAERKRISNSIAARDVVNSPLKELDTKYLQESLRSYMAQLPEYLRNVITLRDLAELSYMEIGKILGISAGTARVYRCKAIQLLAVWMRKDQ